MNGDREILFAQNESEARSRFLIYRRHDPFFDVGQALLSSEDISDYARVAAMIYPFDISRLKPASYEFRAGGVFCYWDENKNFIRREIVNSRAIELPNNSISYVEIDSEIQLPDYMVMRLNLTISHVHRGILLGTGPLVDPGFSGRILIPLHNLTSRPYVIPVSEGLIWAEFTKTSHAANSTRGTTVLRRIGEFRPLPKRKVRRTAEDYLKRAGDGEPIQSSIPQAIQEARNNAERAMENVRTVSWIGAISILVTMGGLIAGAMYSLAQIYQVTQSADAIAHSAMQTGAAMYGLVSNSQSENASQLKQVRSNIAALREQFERLNSNGSRRDKEVQLRQNDLKQATDEIARDRVIIDQNRELLSKFAESLRALEQEVHTMPGRAH